MPKLTDFKNKIGGFSLIEMIVSLAIISLISSLLIANYRQNQQEQAVVAESESLVNWIREVQNRAFHGTKNGAQIPYGWGVYLNPSASTSLYYVFADINDDKTYQEIELGQTVNLNNRVRIQSVSPTPLSVFFLSPDPDLYVNGVSLGTSSASITLSSRNGVFQKTIRVTDLGGKVYVE